MKNQRMKGGVFSIFAMLLLMMWGLSGCSQDSDNGSSSSSIKEGKFIDSAVQGLSYSSGSQSGTTDENGVFMYEEGEFVTFFVGDIVIGSALGKDTMTPVDLVEGATDATNSTVVNIARFLQTLDSDGDASNGITIADSIHDSAQGKTLNFDVSASVFESDADTLAIIASLTSNQLVSSSSAQAHLESTIASLSDSTSQTSDTSLIGGSVQGKALNLSGTIETFAGNDLTGYQDGIGTEALFRFPTSITTDGTHLYVIDDFYIRKIHISTKEVNTLAGNGLDTAVDGTGTEAGFEYPQEITTDGTHLYVTDDSGIRTISISTGEVSTLYSLENEFTSITAITANENELYFCQTYDDEDFELDTANIRKLNISTGIISDMSQELPFCGSIMTTDGTFLYFSEYASAEVTTVFKMDFSSGEVETLFSVQEDVGDDIYDMTSDGTNLYMSFRTDYETFLVYRFTNTGVPETLVEANELKNPFGITTDGTRLFLTTAVNEASYSSDDSVTGVVKIAKILKID